MKKTLLAAFSLLAIGCADNNHVEFEHLTSAPGNADVFENEIQIEEGLAVAVVAKPVDDDRERLELDTEVVLVSDDEQVLGIARLEHDSEEQDDRADSMQRGDWAFVIFGRSVGNTVVEVFIDGEREQEIPAMVEEAGLL